MYIYIYIYVCICITYMYMYICRTLRASNMAVENPSPRTTGSGVIKGAVGSRIRNGGAVRGWSQLGDPVEKTSGKQVVKGSQSGWCFGTFFIFPYTGNIHPN